MAETVSTSLIVVVLLAKTKEDKLRIALPTIVKGSSVVVIEKETLDKSTNPSPIKDIPEPFNVPVSCTESNVTTAFPVTLSNVLKDVVNIVKGESSITSEAALSGGLKVNVHETLSKVKVA